MTDVKSIWRISFAAMIASVIGAFLAALTLQNAGLLSLVPPVTWENPEPVADVIQGEELSLYASAFTAWAALFLLLPVYVFVWSARRSETDYTVWLAFWTVSFFAYLIHLAVSMFWFFGGDFEAMTTSSRVSAFWPGMIICLLWGFDIRLGLRKVKGFAVIVYRSVVHLMVFVLFFGGSAFTGELTSVKMLGMALFAAMITGMTLWLRDLIRKRIA